MDEITPTSGNPALDNILEYFSVEKLAEVLEAVGYSPREEIEALIAAIRDTNRPGLRITAIKALHDRRLQILKSSGQLITAEESFTDEHGRRRVLSTQVVAGALNPSKVRSANNGSEEDSTEEVPQEGLVPLPEAPTGGPKAIVDEPPAGGAGNSLPGLASG